MIVTTTQNDPHIEIESVNILIRQRADGLIIAPSNSQSHTLRSLFARLSVPVVAMDRPLSGSRVPSVVADNFAGASLATRHLIEHGYRRILCLTSETSLYTIRERIRGYRKTVEAAGLDCIPDTSIKDYKSAEHALRSVLQSSAPPDAIFTFKTAPQSTPSKHYKSSTYLFQVMLRYSDMMTLSWQLRFAHPLL